MVIKAGYFALVTSHVTRYITNACVSDVLQS